MSYHITIQYLVFRYEAFLFWVSLIKPALSYATLFSIVKVPLFILLSNVMSCSWLTGLMEKVVSSLNVSSVKILMLYVERKQ